MYGDVHKYFLQFMLKNGNISTEKALEFCKNCSEEIKDLEAVQNLILEINQNISKQDLKIAKTTCEVTSAINFTLLNTVNDNVCKLQTNYTVGETEYFQQLLKEIISADDHKLQNMACYNLSDTLINHIRKDTVEILLNNWLKQGYLVEKDSFIYLGPRCIAEFAPYFQVHCKDYYKPCHLCSEPVFSGKICSSCNIINHGHCIEKWLTRQKNCPNCKRIWEEGSQSQNSMEVDLQEDNSSDDDHEEIATPRRSQRKSARLS